MRRFVLRNRVKRVVLLTAKSGETFRGVLWEFDREAFVLRQAHHLDPGGRAVQIDGEFVILAPEVAYVQFL